MKTRAGLIASTILWLLSANLYAQVGIGTNTPAASAALEVASNTNNKGILIPRITATQKDAISNPAEGLMIYQTSAPVGFYYFTNNSWRLIITQTDLDTKVTKVGGKELSSNDYTSAEKTKLAAISGSNTGDQDLSVLATIASVALKANAIDVNADLATKVDKIIGKELSSNDYTSVEKTKLAEISGSNTGDQDLSALATIAAVALKANTADVNTAMSLKANAADLISGLTLKVDQVSGKNLSSNDYTSAEKTKLAGISGSNTGDQDLSALATIASVALKANTTDVNADLALKANNAEVTNSLALKANITDLNTALALKAPLASPTLVTPNIGVATGTSLSVSGQLTSTVVTGTAPLVVSSTTPVANLNIGGNAATATLASTVITNANLTGDVISSGSNVTIIGAGRVTNAMLAGSIDLTSKVTGILPSSNGGTGNGFTNITGPTTSVKTFTLPDASATILTSNAAVSVAQGGTGQTTYTDGQLLIGNTTGNTLTKATLTPGAGISITNTSGGITIANTSGVSNGTTVGDVNYWNGSAWVKIAPGYDGAYLQLKNKVPTWSFLSGITTAVVEVISATGRIWMDRNLGAVQVAASSTDVSSYGDLYQWGRGTDGHQIRTSTTINTLSDTDLPGHGFFILAGNNPNNWLSTRNNNLWQGVDGVNNPCPSGYRLPTSTEWNAELTSWGTGQNATKAYASPLKLPVAGFRAYNDGTIVSNNTTGQYWSSTVQASDRTILGFNSTQGVLTKGDNSRGVGVSVRCIKD